MRNPHDTPGFPSKQELEELYPKLLLYAKKLHRKKLRAIPPVRQPQDYVQEAMKSWLSGVRKKPEGIEAFVFLCGTIRSKMGHDLARMHLRITRLPEPEKENMLTTEIETDLQNKFDFEKAKQLIQDDPFLQELLRWKYQDPNLRPRDLAALLEVSPHEIYNATKRLKRKLNELQSRRGDKKEG